jgi:hypothetical protein
MGHRSMLFHPASGRQFDNTPDGQRFPLNQHAADTNDAPITVVVDWPKLLAK